MLSTSDLSAPARYFPFEYGKYSTAPGLHKLGKSFGNGEADLKVFQLDQQFPSYRENKEACRKEEYQKYVCHWHEKAFTLKTICNFIIDRLEHEYPDVFLRSEDRGKCNIQNHVTGDQLLFDDNGNLLGPTPHQDLLDALAFQIQEDLAIWQVQDGKDWMSTIHLCAPNHWSPADKVGKPFSEVHLPVAGMEAMRARYQPMLRSLLQGGTYVRFAWGLSTDTRLNHHPVPPQRIEPQSWEGRAFDPANPQLYVRTERQTLTGFPEVQAVLFTIRTYFEDVNKLLSSQKRQLRSVIESMSQETLAYKGLIGHQEQIMEFLA